MLKKAFRLLLAWLIRLVQRKAEKFVGDITVPAPRS